MTGTTYDKNKVEISHNFVAFSEYMNFKWDKNAQLETLHLVVKINKKNFPGLGSSGNEILLIKSIL